MSVKFLERFSNDFSQLLESEYDYNVVIEVGKQHNKQLFKSHKLILYQRSSFFRQKLGGAPKKINVFEIWLPNITVTKWRNWRKVAKPAKGCETGERWQTIKR
ncbi:hypothetical protein C2G38_2172971 [Gigaspora rosea]|uniref:BTB domain-containing protein n=1 Tax=Gigaspora rosea TaxID=44941 RepID=A0A397VPB9_9GLOM|nr:hypothetical protein C2G38_2172971 [Gigaspora rosea]